MLSLYNAQQVGGGIHMRKTKYKGYEVYSNGVVLNSNKEKVGSFIDSGGYQYILVPKPVRAHRFIYEAFNGEIPEGLQIHHIDNDRLNNSIDNLEAITASENSTIARATSQVDRTIKSVGVYTKDGELLATYKSATEAERLTLNTIKFKHQRISECLRGAKEDHRGYVYKRVDLNEIGYNPNSFDGVIWDGKTVNRMAF